MSYIELLQSYTSHIAVIVIIIMVGLWVYVNRSESLDELDELDIEDDDDVNKRRPSKKIKN